MSSIPRSIIEASLGRWSEACGERVTALFDQAQVPLSALEASVRGGLTERCTGCRMMIERLPAEPSLALIEALAGGLEPAPQVREACGVAEQLGLPLISGWDAAGEQLWAKLYVNASDASTELRTELARRLGLARAGAPHVVGFNLCPGQVQTKVYEQWSALPEPAPPFVHSAVGGRGLAGVVRSRVVDDQALRTKAWFVAPRTGDADDLLAALPGWDPEAVRAALPFEPGVVRSIGWSGSGRVWTVYFKPSSVASTSWNLDPEVCVGSPSCEVGIYVEPAAHAERAYCRTEEHALSYRVRRGQLVPLEVEALMAWARSCMVQHERNGTPLSFSSPPEPWHVVVQTVPG